MNNAAFFNSIRSLFGSMSQSQVAGCETLLAAMHGLPITYQAYLLGSAFHETGRRMQPIKETVQEYHKDANPSDATVVARLDAAYRKGLLGSVENPYWRYDTEGKAWFGRGLAQITHKTNYAKAAEKLGVDLLGNPSLALHPSVAAQILVRGCTEGWFTGKKLSDYLPTDYHNARRVVNGTDRAADIAGYARRFETALVAGQADTTWTKAPTTPAGGVKPAPAPAQATKPQSPLAVAVALAIAAVAAIYAWFTKG